MHELVKVDHRTHNYRGYNIVKNGNGLKYTIKQGRKTVYKTGFILLSEAVKYIDEGFNQYERHISNR